MADSRRGKKQNSNKNNQAHTEWMDSKKEGRPKQVFIKLGDCTCGAGKDAEIHPSACNVNTPDLGWKR